MSRLEELRSRWEQLAPKYGMTKKLAELAELSPEHVSRLLNRHYENTTLATLERLEQGVSVLEAEAKEASAA